MGESRARTMATKLRPSAVLAMVAACAAWEAAGLPDDVSALCRAWGAAEGRSPVSARWYLARAWGEGWVRSGSTRVTGAGRAELEGRRAA